VTSLTHVCSYSGIPAAVQVELSLFSVFIYFCVFKMTELSTSRNALHKYRLLLRIKTAYLYWMEYVPSFGFVMKGICF
jgi:hypothetical protein